MASEILNGMLASDGKRISPYEVKSMLLAFGPSATQHRPSLLELSAGF